MLSVEAHLELERLARVPWTQVRYAQRAQIVLLAADGLTNKETAQRLRTRSARVSKWRTRLAAEEARHGTWHARYSRWQQGHPVAESFPEGDCATA
jgi:hypothetical protein